MAGEMRQEWTWRDMFRSIGLAFSFSRLIVGFFGLALMVGADGLLAWAGYEAMDAGRDLNGAVTSAWLVWVGTELFWYIRVIVLGYLFLGTATAIAYGVKGELLDGEGAGAKESISFALKKLGTVFWTPVIFWIYILLMACLGLGFWLLPVIIAKWAGWTLYASLIWWAVGYFFIFIFSVLAAMGFLAFAFSFFLAPPIIAVRQEGALDAVLDTIDLMRGKGAFWVSILVIAAAMLLGPIFLGKTFDVGYDVAEVAMSIDDGNDFDEVVDAMPTQIQPRSGTFFYCSRIFWPKQYRQPSASMLKTEWAPLSSARSAEMRHRISGWILGLWVLILAGFSMSFTLGAFVSAATLTYLIVREEEEFLEPVSVEPPTPVAPAKDEPAKDEKKSEEKKKPAKDEKKDEKKSDKHSKKDSKKDSKRSSKKDSKKDSKKN
jgi:hypothetical protein